ncbi:PRAME family member 18 [Fukomys damarensis]|uniref:PRAME family member 18 n=1 Tax=Fukomys damarensis TaxID=885580 RepID=A0A091DKL8_FUKDA|nr:PRAME family member 18 [Fukomys damarensis]
MSGMSRSQEASGSWPKFSGSLLAPPQEVETARAVPFIHSQYMWLSNAQSLSDRTDSNDQNPLLHSGVMTRPEVWDSEADSKKQRFLEMSMQSPGPLYEQAKHSLLKSDIIACNALDGPPRLIFHETFIEAFTGGQNEVVKVMMVAWPFPCLPLESLMDRRKQEYPQHKLEKLQLEERNLQSLKPCWMGWICYLHKKLTPGECGTHIREEGCWDSAEEHRWKLPVQDLKVNGDFWNARAWTPDNTGRGQRVDGHLVTRKKQLLKVMEDLTMSGNVNGFQTYCFDWAQQRRHFVHLCCRTMEIYKMPLDGLKMLELNCVQEV